MSVLNSQILFVIKSRQLSQTLCNAAFVTLFLFLTMNNQGLAQPGQCLPGGCNVGIPYGANQTTTSGTFVNSLAITYAGEFNRYNVVAGNQYEWSLCAADGAVNPTPDMLLTLVDDLSNAILCFSDNVCGLQPKILWTAPFTGAVRVYLHTPNCGTNTSSHTVRWRCAACAPLQAPANDLICSAQPIACGQTLAGSTINATNTGTAEGGANNCSGNNFNPGVWYVFAGNGQTVTASLCATIWDSWIQVYSGASCNAINCVGGVDDSGPACIGSTSASISWNTTVGLNYYIFVAGFSSESAFNIAVTCASTPPGVVVASDCANAVNICTNSSFQIDPNGSGNVVEFVAGSISNPSTNPASSNAGCLLSGELNSTWMIVNIASSGTLEFSFGAAGGFGCLDWIMWPYNGTTTCDQILADQFPPIRCNWNAFCESYTGLATPLPALGQSGNFEPEINVTCGQRFLICLSNFSSQTTSVPLNFFGTAIISCSTFTPITVNSPTICLGASATLTANGGNSYTWSPAVGLSATTGATVIATPSATTTYTVNGTGPCGAGNAVSTVTVTVPTPYVLSYLGPYCSTEGQDVPQNTWSLGGTYSYTPAGLSFDPDTGTIDPAASTPGTYTVTFTPLGCGQPQQTTVAVLPAVVADGIYHD